MQWNWIKNSRINLVCKILNFNLNFRQKSRNWIFILNFHWFFHTSPFIWYISIHLVKYLDKPIKCLEMRAKIKSARQINVENMTFSPNSSILMKKCFFCYFKSQISKWKHKSERLSVTRGIKDSYSLSNKQKKNSVSTDHPVWWDLILNNVTILIFPSN